MGILANSQRKELVRSGTDVEREGLLTISILNHPNGV